MIELIRANIDWERLGSGYEKYEAAIEDAVMSKDGSSLTVNMRLNFVMPFESHEQICSVIMKKIPVLENVFIFYEYEISGFMQDDEAAVRLFTEHMIDIVDGSYAAVTKTIVSEDVRIDGDEIVVPAVGGVAVARLNRDVSLKFEELLSEKLNMDKKVIFVNSEKVVNAAAELKIKREQDDIKQAVRRKEQAKKMAAACDIAYGSGQAGTSDQSGIRNVKAAVHASNGIKRKRRRRDLRETPVEGNRIMGKDIKGRPMELSEVFSNVGTTGVTVEGILSEKNSRTIKSGSKLMKLVITDKKTSLAMKAFVSKKKWNDVDENLKPGCFVKAQGDIEEDVYEHEVMLNVMSIEKGELKKKEDNSEIKRVELHAHTKMSAMDGLSEPADLVRRAVEWGHAAIAITDHGVAQAFPDAMHAADGSDIKVIYGMEAYLYNDDGCRDREGNINLKARKYNHAILLAKNQKGLKNLYKLVSISHLKYIYKKPLLPKSVIEEYREGIILGSACEAGEVFRAIVRGKSEEEIEELAGFYDYLEIQPIINNHFMIDSSRHPSIRDDEDLRDLNRRVIALGEKLGKPVAATCDAHYIDEEDGKFREILLAGQGYKDITGGLFFRTTDEMLEEFSYLGEEKAREVVIDVPNMIADKIGYVKPIADGKFPPEIENADVELRKECNERAEDIYGSPLPEKIKARLDKELDSIIGNGYAVMYASAEMLVKKSLADGFLVGSRGSVGSSFAATMAGITEVNPLPPHYICPECKYLEWGDANEYDCGIDLPEKRCPVCGTMLNQDGFTIPFETFLGFKGDKEPDIDLNFAGEYQATAHKYVEEIFGANNVYKAGTIGTLKNKTAYGFVKKYFDARGISTGKYETDRLVKGCVGVKRTTGQHPGGIIIVPEDHEIYEFCPVQHPANDMSSDVVTTHFDYHSINENLLKLDILGHDVPSMIRHLQDITGVDPLKVPLKDEKVNSIFNSIEGLGIVDKDYKFKHGSYGVPEFGTSFVRQMLDDTEPTRFGDFVRIAGFSHGTNVWLNNAKEFITQGTASMKEAISTRDDIMNYLILKGLPNEKAFKIMEKVRKGKGLSDDEEAMMREYNVPDWYIRSCQLIEYMFPRAHAVAYVIMSYRIAYYKVYYPREFYAVIFTTKLEEFNWDVIKRGPRAILQKLEEIQVKGDEASNKEEAEAVPYELAYEMYARGYEFEAPTLEHSRAMKFIVKNGRVQVPLCALDGVGESAGKTIEEEYEKRPFSTVEDLRVRAGANRTAVESLREAGMLAGLPETDQLCFL